MMDNLQYILPLGLTELLNKFNEKLAPLSNELIFSASEIKTTHENKEYKAVRLKYTLLVSFYFEIDFLLLGDLIGWRYYPYTRVSSREKIRARVLINEERTFVELNDSFSKWMSNLHAIQELENPLEYFKNDKFLKFYAGEFLEIIPLKEDDKISPLNTNDQILVKEILKNQLSFIKKEKNAAHDHQKQNDLGIAEEMLKELDENLSRLTVYDIKRNWSIVFGALKKWCSEGFLNFLKIDKANGYDLSRMIGSFVGGVFGIPKISE